MVLYEPVWLTGCMVGADSGVVNWISKQIIGFKHSQNETEKKCVRLNETNIKINLVNKSVIFRSATSVLLE